MYYLTFITITKCITLITVTLLTSANQQLHEISTRTPQSIEILMKWLAQHFTFMIKSSTPHLSNCDICRSLNKIHIHHCGKLCSKQQYKVLSLTFHPALLPNYCACRINTTFHVKLALAAADDIWTEDCLK